MIFLWPFLVLVWAASVVWKPSEDEFYQPPPNLESEPVGSILKVRVTPRPLRSLYFRAQANNSWQFLVRSNDHLGQPIAFVTTLIAPFEPNEKKLVSYQIAQDSACSDCSPSYALLLDGSLNTITTQFEMVFIQMALDRGYYVVTPDYQGPAGLFTGGTQAGQATLDSIRAVLQSSELTGLSSDAKTVMWGYSGGSIATGWASSLHSMYAPELDIVGATFGGTVANLTVAVEQIDGGMFSGMVAAGIMGLAKGYPYVNSVLQSVLDPRLYARLQYAENNCLLPTILEFTGTSFFFGQSPWSSHAHQVFQDPIVRQIIANNTLGNNRALLPHFPIMVYHEYFDGIIPMVGSEHVFQTWCDSGVSVELNIELAGNHISGLLTNAPMAISWIDDRFDNVVISGCKRNQRFSNLLHPDVTSVWEVAKIIASMLINKLRHYPTGWDVADV